MLNDVIAPLAEWCRTQLSEGERFDPGHLKRLCSEARHAWASAVFSEASDETLVRYFSFHMTALSDLCVMIPPDLAVGAELTDLAAILYNDYRHHIRQQINLPAGLVIRRLECLQEDLKFLARSAAGKIGSVSLRSAVEDLLSEVAGISRTGNCTAGSLSYIESLVKAVNGIFRTCTCSCADRELCNLLIAMNFNQIGFFLHLEETLRQQISALSTDDRLAGLRKQKVYFRQPLTGAAYNVSWTSIGEMVRHWINEETAMIEKSAAAANATKPAIPEKLGFNLSVAQLACLTKALVHAGAYLSDITGILNLSARYFRSKNQENISKGSLSKEYYSVSQKTAATVLDLLQRMTANIRKEYFPVFAVIALIHLSL